MHVQQIISHNILSCVAHNILQMEIFNAKKEEFVMAYVSLPIYRESSSQLKMPLHSSGRSVPVTKKGVLRDIKKEFKRILIDDEVLSWQEGKEKTLRPIFSLAGADDTHGLCKSSFSEIYEDAGWYSI